MTSSERTFGMSWIPAEAAHEYLGCHGRPDPASDLASVAEALGADFAFVPAVESWAAAYACELQKRGIAVAWAVPGPLGIVADRLGWAEVLRLSAGEGGVLAAPLAKALDDTIEMIRVGGFARADVMVLADDLAADSGWLVAPEFALRELMPGAVCAAEQAMEFGMASIYHSDGDVSVLFDALHDAGYTGVHIGALPGDVLAAVCGSAWEGRLAVMGGVAARDLALGRAVDLGDRIASVAAAGRLMVCDDGGITTAEELRTLHDVYCRARATLEG